MTDPIVLDTSGNLRSMDWLHDKYGPFVIYDPPPATGPARVWRITTLREKCNAPAALVVKTLSRAERGDPQPEPGIKSAFYWPDAPEDADAGPAGAPFEGVTPGRCVAGYANGEGDVGFGMGNGAYYYPDRGERGPHAVWIHGAETRSQLILGLGMLPGTEHDHFDVEFTLSDDGPEDPEPTDPDTEFLSLMQQIVDTLNRLADAIEQPYLVTIAREVPSDD